MCTVFPYRNVPKPTLEHAKQCRLLVETKLCQDEDGWGKDPSLFAAGFAREEDGSEGTGGEDDRGEPHGLGHGGGEGRGLSR